MAAKRTAVEHAGKNLDVFITGTKLTIEIDLSKKVGETGGGNAKIASSEGWLRAGDGVSITPITVVRTTKKTK
jgi:hypothetical protein